MPHLFANISVGSHTKLCRIDQKFQCIVVIRKSALQSAQVPSPFLNRFEKYFLSFESVYNTVCKQLPKNLKKLLDIVHNKVSFWQCFCQFLYINYVGNKVSRGYAEF